MGVRRGGKTGISPLETGTKNENFVEILKAALKPNRKTLPTCQVGLKWSALD